MAQDLRDIITRNSATLVADALGVLGLALLLVGTLYMPVLS